MSTVVLNNSNTVVAETEATGYVQVVSPETAVVEGDSTAYVSQEKVETVVVQVNTATTVVAGFQGPPGPAGIAEEDVVYSKRIDFISDDLLYKGEAPVGSSESSPVWRVRKITVSPDGDVTELWAGGSAEFVNTWTGRLGFVYS